MEKEVVVGDEGGGEVVRLWLKKPDGSHLVVEFGAGETALGFSLFEERTNEEGYPVDTEYLAHADIVKVREDIYKVNFFEQDEKSGETTSLGDAEIDITSC